MMTREDIYDVLTEILREIFDDPNVIATPELSASDIPEWDSFNHISLVVATEMRFGVKFRTSEIEELRNVGEFVALIERKRQAA
jgi:acyl carrier protein